MGVFPLFVEESIYFPFKEIEKHFCTFSQENRQLLTILGFKSITKVFNESDKEKLNKNCISEHTECINSLFSFLFFKIILYELISRQIVWNLC